MTQSPTFEEYLLSGMLLHPENVVAVRRIVEANDFINKDLGKIYDTILNVFDTSGHVDLPTVGHALHGSNLASRLVELTGYSIHTQILYYAKAITEQAMLRTARDEVRLLHEQIQDAVGGGDVGEALAQTQHTLSEIQQRFNRNDTRHVSDDLEEAVCDLKNLREGRVRRLLPFGFFDLDRMTGGMDLGDFVVISAPRKSGKTTLLIQVLMHNAFKGTPTAMFSQEMSRRQIIERHAVIEADVDWRDALCQNVPDSHWEKLILSVQNLKDAALYINDRINSVMDIRNELEILRQSADIKLVGVDYIQMVRSAIGKRSDTREREVAAISAGLKMIAKDFNVVVLAASQVNKEWETRESRAIEQDMDKMITIRREGREKCRAIQTVILLISGLCNVPGRATISGSYNFCTKRKQGALLTLPRAASWTKLDDRRRCELRREVSRL